VSKFIIVMDVSEMGSKELQQLPASKQPTTANTLATKLHF